MAALDSAPVPSQQQFSGCLIRLAWMVFGNAALVVFAIVIARGEAFSLSWPDAAFWAVVAFVLAVRYLDIRRFGGLTAEGQPVSIHHWRRYALLYPAAALSLWAVAHGLAWMGM